MIEETTRVVFKVGGQEFKTRKEAEEHEQEEFNRRMRGRLQDIYPKSPYDKEKGIMFSYHFAERNGWSDSKFAVIVDMVENPEKWIETLTHIKVAKDVRKKEHPFQTWDPYTD